MISLTKQLFSKKKKLPVENKIEWIYPADDPDEPLKRIGRTTP